MLELATELRSAPLKRLPSMKPQASLVATKLLLIPLGHAETASGQTLELPMRQRSMCQSHLSQGTSTLFQMAEQLLLAFLKRLGLATMEVHRLLLQVYPQIAQRHWQVKPR